jgi:predicted solute-binding protein
MKQKSGEAYFDKDGIPLVFSVADNKYFRDESAEVDPMQQMIATQWSSEAFQQEYAVQMAKAYGIPPEEFEAYKASLKVDRFGPRIDIPRKDLSPEKLR